MQYKEFPGHKTFVIIHNIGFGVMEDPYTELDISTSCDSLEEAEKEAKSIKVANNTPEEIASSWVPNTYHINVNTLTDEGKRLLDAFHIKFDQLLDKAKTEGVRPIQIGDTTVYMHPCKEFDDDTPMPIIGPSRIVWSEPKK